MGCFVRNKVLIFSAVICSLLFVSCESNVEEKIQGVKLYEGAIIQNASGELSNFNLLDGNYSKVENDKVIGIYDSGSESYISTKNGEYFYFKDGVENKINDIGITASDMKVSKGGSNLSYFENEDGMFQLKLRSLVDNSSIEFNSNVYISSTYMDWLDDNNIVYYGISDERVNGIFIYNVKEKKENLFYKLDNGIVQYLKTTDNGLLFIQETINNERILRVIDNSGSNSQIISKEVMLIKDILNIGEDYYFLGKVVGGIESLYRIGNNKIKRLVFDFPTVIDFEKGLSKDSENNILFIGKSNVSSQIEEVYKITSKGTISKVNESAKEYSFVKYQ